MNIVVFASRLSSKKNGMKEYSAWSKALLNAPCKRQLKKEKKSQTRRCLAEHWQLNPVKTKLLIFCEPAAAINPLLVKSESFAGAAERRGK